MFFETTIMEKTADLAMVQKTNIDALHKEGKSQRVITERCGCLQSAVSKHIKCKVDWRKNLGRKGAQATGMTASLRILSSKADSTLVRASQGVDWSWSQCIKSHTLRRLQEKGYQATSEPETTSEASYLGCGEKELSGPKSSFQMKVNVAFRLEIKVPESGGRVERHRIHVAWSPVWSFHSQWWFGLPCHLLVLVHCVFWSPQSTQPSTRKF